MSERDFIKHYFKLYIQLNFYNAINFYNSNTFLYI